MTRPEAQGGKQKETAQGGKSMAVPRVAGLVLGDLPEGPGWQQVSRRLRGARTCTN